MHCELITWERFQALARQLAFTIRLAPYHPDLIVAIGRGGYMPARIVSDYLDVFDLTDIKIEHYHGAHKERFARIRYPLPADVAGKRVLLIDDVSDTGDTFEIAIRHLHERAEPAELKTAVLHHKLASTYTPDFFAEVVREWRWITYPWAVMEDLRYLLGSMDPPPASLDEFARRLRECHDLEAAQQTLEDIFAMPRM